MPSEKKMVPVYVGFIVERGRFLSSFVTDEPQFAKYIAGEKVDDALPNNTVQVFKCEIDVSNPVIVASWTPEGEDVKVYHAAD